MSGATAARLSVHQKAEEEVYKLDRRVKADFVNFCHHFRQNPDRPSLDLKPLKGHPDVYRAKVNPSFRALLAKAGVDIVGVPQWVVVAVRDRKDVYEELSVAINRVTGAIEFVDLGAVGDSVLRRAGITLTPAEYDVDSIPAAPTATPAAPASRPLLADVTADELRELGVAGPLIELARSVVDSAELDELVRDAPALSKDVLYGLAAGMNVEEVRSEITAPVQVDAPDPTDMAAALARTAVTTVDDGLQEILDEGDFRTWKVFLHPTQARLVNRHYSGPARVSGGPGTGKTVVALHRVKQLVGALAPGTDRPILLTTFTKNLATDLRQRLSSLLDQTELARVDIAHIDQLAARVLTENTGSGGRRRRIDNAAALALMRQIHSQGVDVRWTPEFLLDEWDQVVLGQTLTARKQYFEARRAGRGRSLTRPDRNQVWTLLEQFTARLDRDRVETWGQTATRAAQIEATRAAQIEKNGEHLDESSGTRYRRYRYRHVVVDEAQDLSAAHWTMLRAMVPRTGNDMFIAGDTHQRIYDNRVTLGTVGINIRGRSSRLTLSYRTTREILAHATAVVAPETYDDLDDGTDTLDGYRSVLHGPAPELVGYPDWSTELDALSSAIRQWRDKGDGADKLVGSVAVCVAARDRVADVRAHLATHDITSAELTKDGPQGDGDIHVGTMHRFKGLEYRNLAIVGLSDGVLPRPGIAHLRTTEPTRFIRENAKSRSLLFVAITRARDVVRISWHGKPSSLLPIPST